MGRRHREAKPWATYPTDGPISGARRSPDDHTLALIGAGTVELVDLVGQRRVATIAVRGAVNLAFSADSGLLAVAGSTGDITLVDTDTGLVRNRWQAAAGPVESAAFTPDGRFIVSGGYDGKAAFWSVDAPTTANAFIDVVHGASPISVVVLQNDIVTIHPSGPSVLWDINADNRLGRACAIVGRDLTETEWTEIMPDRPYQQTCPGSA